MLVWREKIVKGRIEEFIGPFTVPHHNECSKIVAKDQERVIKRYSTSQIRPFWEQLSMIDDSMTERKIKDRHGQTEKDPDEPEYEDSNVQLNVDQQLYGEKSITDDSDNLTKKSLKYDKS